MEETTEELLAEDGFMTGFSVGNWLNRTGQDMLIIGARLNRSEFGPLDIGLFHSALDDKLGKVIHTTSQTTSFFE